MQGTCCLLSDCLEILEVVTKKKKIVLFSIVDFEHRIKAEDHIEFIYPFTLSVIGEYFLSTRHSTRC